MPFASKAQARAMHAKASRGEIAASTVQEFDRATDFAHLPEKTTMKHHHAGSSKHHGHERHPKARAEGSMDAGASGHGRDGIPTTIHHQHGAAGSHEHTRHHGHQSHINTGHPAELENFHEKMGRNG